jgi:hypothetical protein
VRLTVGPKPIAHHARPLAIMVRSMGTSIRDLRPVEGDASVPFDAPRVDDIALPVMWTADDDTSDHGMVRVAHRILVADGTYPMSADVRIEATVGVADLEALGFHLVRLYRDTSGMTVFMLGDAVALTGFIGGRGGTLHVSTADVDSLDLVVATLRERFPGVVAPEAMAMRSWALGPHGARADVVRHDFPGWEPTRPNFPMAARATLDQLVALTRPAGGSVMVWHGAPGTGKTTAIRSLAREWQGWCDLELIIDPESLFANAGYLMSVLTSGPLGDDASGEEHIEGGDAEASKRWKLVVVEDCDDLLLRSARAGSNGQLSRLLNVCDGLLGQELNVIMLFTTNAPVHAVHPAVLRPGRCLATVEFGPFTAAEVAARPSGLPGREMTLAELMAAEGGLPAVVGAQPEEPINGYL